MTDPTMRDILTEFATLRGEMQRQRRAARRTDTIRQIAAVAVAATLLALVPLGLQAANPFNDLDPGSPHNEDIDLIYNAGLTTGCSTEAFCSNNLLTRQELASFLARTAGLGDHPPVVNAARAVQAANADQLGGQPASAYLRNGASPTFAGLQVTGSLTHEYAPRIVRSIAPFAYGTVYATGKTLSGTHNFTVEYNATAKRYEITFPGVEYAYGPYLTVATPIDAGRTVSATGGVDGKLFITITDHTGTYMQGQFQFITYQATTP